MVSNFTWLVSLKTYKLVCECITRTYVETEEAELHIFGSQGKAEVWKRNFRSLEVLAKMKCGSGLIHIWKSWQNKCGRWTRSFESWPSGSTESGTSVFWQSRKSRIVDAELHIFGSPGRDEMRKWTYPYLEVLVEKVRKKNEIFRSPGRAEVRKVELLIFGSKDRAELRKQSFRLLKVLAEKSWCPEAELYIVGSKGRREVRKWNFTSYEELAQQKCGTDFMSHHW